MCGDIAGVSPAELGGLPHSHQQLGAPPGSHLPPWLVLSEMGGWQVDGSGDAAGDAASPMGEAGC